MIKLAQPILTSHYLVESANISNENSETLANALRNGETYRNDCLRISLMDDSLTLKVEKVKGIEYVTDRLTFKITEYINRYTFLADELLNDINEWLHQLERTIF